MLGVAIIEPVGGHGGMQYYDIKLVETLRRQGVDVRFYTCDLTKVPDSISNITKFPFKGVYGKSPKLLRLIRFIIALTKSLINAHKANIHVVHFHVFGVGGPEIISMLCAKLFKFHIVISAHDVEHFVIQERIFFSNWVFSAAHCIIAHSQTGKNELTSKYPHIKDKLTVIPLGNYVDYFSKKPAKNFARTVLGIPFDTEVLLFFGQIKRVKGLDILLKAMPKVIHHFPKLQLIIAGKPWKDDFAVYNSLIDSLGIRSNIVIKLGYVAEQDVCPYFSASDIAILPYRKIYQSAVLLLAMCSHCPFIASDIVGMKEVVIDGNNGTLFRDGDPESLSECIIWHLSNKDKALHMAELAFKKMVDEYSWENVAEMTAKVYRNAFTV
jgi:D-inositol-3-phosphate glycosyltransferase